MRIHPIQTNFLQMEIRDPGSGQKPPSASGDVILGNGAREVALNFIPSPSPNVTSYHVILDETHVVSEPPVSPLEFQSILAELMSFKIRATYYPFPQGSVTFKEVTMETAVQAQGAPGEVSVGFVENATCHVNYTGLSCEQCAQGTGIIEVVTSRCHGSKISISQKQWPYKYGREKNEKIDVYKFHDYTQEQNDSPYFYSIFRQCKWPSLSRKMIEIQKFCCHGNLTSHSTSLLVSSLEEDGLWTIVSPVNI